MLELILNILRYIFEFAQLLVAGGYFMVLDIDSQSFVFIYFFFQIKEAEPLTSDLKINWTSLPELVHPLGGELPPERLEKKCQQLENLASAVNTIYSPGDVIVDFCSGGGHLAILLAYLFPDATVYLVENKEESLKRAIKRVEALELKNCRFFQGNMDYFKGIYVLYK